jgi:hypothetical protein
MEMDYKEFIESKSIQVTATGIEVKKNELNNMLFEFQKDIVRWALAKGKAAIFADCGDGKTAMQLEWAEKIRTRTGGKVIIIAPLAVSQQTEREGRKFGIKVNICESMNDVTADAVNITNYEKLQKFNADEFIAVVLDESSIIKSYSGKIRNQIIEKFAQTPYKLACTATPAPNDYMELGNHSEFLGVMTRAEMLAMYFVHDGGETSKWRLKGHAKDLFWKWLASWCVVLDDPKKLGYDIAGYDLPKLNIHTVVVDSSVTINEQLSLTERRQARRDSLGARCERAADMVNNSDDKWLVWCDLNDEANLANKLIDNSVNVQGSDSDEYKAKNMLDFANGDLKCLITKPKIAGYGMNWQICHKVIFLGLSDSFEAFYQAVRRCWRFGQTEDVDVYVIISYCEGAVLDNVQRKQGEADKMKQNLIELTKDLTKRELTATSRITSEYQPSITMILPKWSEFKNA